MDLNAPAPYDDENEPPPETPMDSYRREREERKSKMKRLREEEQSKTPVTKVAKTARAISACTASDRLKAVGPLPEGWVDCPPFGDSIDGLIPSKVPLSDTFNELLEPGMRYSRSHVMRKLKTLGRDVGMVIDLTNTTRYYSSSEWTRNGVKHLKIACRGRDEVPDPGSVNQFVFEVTRYFFQNPGKVRPNKQILVHCTHGHNRTGFMIVHYLVRSKRATVEQAIQAFANARPPGIYKEEYIDSLFRFYNERRSEMLVCPATPEWKRVDLNGEARVDDDGEDDGGIMAALEEDLRNSSVMTNDDVLGDPITEENQMELQKICCWGIGVPQNHGPLRFPGSQPVSLDRKNLQLLRQRYYYATWKADGTRYMLLIVREGCYLIDRNFKFRRVQLRFPMKGARDTLTETQHCTLLDGEMVIDTNPKTNTQERRYLVYDVMVLNQKHLTQIPFHERWKLVEKEIIDPRTQDRALNRHYKYDGELFRVRRKDFWMLSTVGKLLKSFIPQLSHEADGLIFQGWDDVYVPRTHEGLLKWKYAHMNSVDFLVKVSPSGSQFSLFLMERGGKFKQLDGARLTLKEQVIPKDLDMKVVECSWNKEEQVWIFMRIRHDKETPNAYHVYEKVMGSIADNITEQTLFAEIDEILRLPMYAERIKQEEAQAKKHHWAQQQQGRRA